MEKKHQARHAYIHIPFCAHKCYYCDFAIFVWQGDHWVDVYLDALEEELNFILQGEKPVMDTIYIGGGTPSLLNERELQRLLRMVGEHFSFAEEIEFSLEANPGSLTPSKLTLLREGGVNRLSIGVQTFQDHLLQRIGRDHHGKEALHAIEIAHQAGFTNLSIDLMYGLPDQTMNDIEEDLKIISQLPLQHLSAYNLIVEERTRFGIDWKKGRLQLPDEELESHMYEWITDRLQELGFLQYELSNFAIPGFQSRHNLAYWLNHSFYGFGAGAWGYLDHMRYENIAALKPYIRQAKEGKMRKQEIPVSEKEEMEEMMFLGLRLMEGISNRRFKERWGLSLDEVYGEEIKQLIQKGLLERYSDGIRLTREGRFLSNEVFVSFLKEN